MKIDLTPFEERVEKKLIGKQVKGDLIIYNYTNECQFKKAWDEYTKMARGLIVRPDGTIVARPFAKFFNLEEQFGSDQLKGLPRYKFEMTEKMDGSLGILYKDDDGVYKIATRGSFESEQAIWATKWLTQHHMVKRANVEYDENVTYLFEIIYPANRIVVNYKDRAELVLIGMVEKETGKIYPYNKVKKEAVMRGFSFPKPIPLTIKEAMDSAAASVMGDFEEGYVIFYPEENMQLKIKLKDYVRLHRLTFGITVKSIWENMMAGKKIKEVFADAPDEVMDWLDHWEGKIKHAVDGHLARAQEAYEEARELETRKEQAIYLKENWPEYMGVVFNLLDDKPWRESIYKMVKPAKEDSNQSFRVIKKEQHDL